MLGGDNQGWPNGRRLDDDVIDIAEQAVGGFLKGTKLPLGDGVNGDDAKLMASFPYIADPVSGFANTQGPPEALAPRLQCRLDGRVTGGPNRGSPVGAGRRTVLSDPTDTSGDRIQEGEET